MGVHHQPDLPAQLRKLENEVAELARIVRRGKKAPNFRDLADADLTQVADGEVPIYDAASGRFVPGTAGGGGASPPVRAKLTDTAATGGDATLITLGDGTNWTVNEDDIGLSVGGDGLITVPTDGLYVCSGAAYWAAQAGSVFFLVGASSDGISTSDQRLAGTTHATVQPVPHIAQLTAGDYILARAETEGAGGSTNVTVYLTIALWAT